MEVTELLKELKKPFPASAHKDRKLPGTEKRWLYIPWQTIRDRLDELLPLDWSTTYSDPAIAGDYMVIRCKLTILISKGGISREGVGNDKTFPELNERGKSKVIGTPPERARADAFRSAAEEFGLAAYLDDQDFVVKYLSSQGDGRAYKYVTEGEMRDAGLAVPKAKPVTPVVKPIAVLTPQPKEKPTYSDRLKEVAKITGHKNKDIVEIATKVLLREIKTGTDIETDEECLAIERAMLGQPRSLHPENQNQVESN